MNAECTPICPGCSRLPVARPSTPTPNIPSELWIEIIRRAGEIDNEFFDHGVPYADDINYYRRVYGPQWRAASRVRLVLSLVSKSFHEAAIKYLHSSFFLDSISSVLDFMNLVKSPEVAQRVRRVTFSELRKDSPSYYAVEDISNAIALCSNLQVYIDYANGSLTWNEFALGALGAAKHIAQDLNVSDIAELPRDDLKFVTQWLPKHSQLKVLRLGNVPGVKHQLPKAPLHFSYLEILDLDIRADNYAEADSLLTSWLPNQSLPRLHTLLCGPGLTSAPALLSFGHQITTLGLHNSPGPPGNTDVPPIQLRSLRKLILTHGVYSSQWDQLPSMIDISTAKIVDIQIMHNLSNVWSNLGGQESVVAPNINSLLNLFLKENIYGTGPTEISFDFTPSAVRSNLWNTLLRNEFTNWFTRLALLDPLVQVQSIYYEEKTGEMKTIPFAEVLDVERESAPASQGNAASITFGFGGFFGPSFAFPSLPSLPPLNLTLNQSLSLNPPQPLPSSGVQLVSFPTHRSKLGRTGGLVRGKNGRLMMRSKAKLKSKKTALKAVGDDAGVEDVEGEGEEIEEVDEFSEVEDGETVEDIEEGKTDELAEVD